MMWIVRVALRRPYTFISGAILVLIAGLVAIMTTPVDIFPAIPLPVATVIWQYNGMSPEEMEERIVTTVERSYSVTVNDIEHIESQSLTGVAVIKVFFQPTADVATGVAQLTAVSQSNTRTLPPGTTPPIILRFNATDVPVKQVNGAMVYIRDVAQVRDGAGVQTNIVRQNGAHGVYLTLLKTGHASTLAVVNQVKALLAQIKPSLAPGLDVQYLADQSLFVRASISGVIREAVIAACLTALMILLFLGSWRSTLIIATSIPLAVLCSIVCLAALGQTLNVMTLASLALAVGILVDDATVTIENINRNMEEGKEILQAIMDGAAQIATPAFVSTISISIVFVPMFFLSGPAAALFRPLAMAVVFAVLASYVLSRTIVPTMAHYLLAADAR